MATTAHGEQRLDAIVRLLDDDSAVVSSAAGEHLVDQARVQALRVRAAIERGSPRQRVIGRRLLERCRLELLEREFDRLSGQLRDLEDLERGALLLASWRYPALDGQQITAALDGLAGDLAKRLPGGRSSQPTWRAICSFLFAEHGFAGNRDDYYNADNSYVNRVLETRRGIPISLCALVLFLARRLELPLVGVGMPFHFLLRFDDDRATLLDPFHGGRLLGRDDCATLCREMGQSFHERFLEPSSPRRILVRMVLNLVEIYNRSDQPERARHLVQLAARLGEFDP